MIATPLQNDELRWHAVLHRDEAADGSFVYAVASTGIYCRPSCPSRRPRRGQVRFFADPEAAEGAGFRACRRCAPREPETEARRRVRLAREYLDNHLDETVTLERLGAAVGGSPYHLQRTFTRLTGMSPKAYADARRMERMKAGLRNGDSVSRATYDAGYTSASRAYEHARARIGMTPADYRRGGRGLRIRSTTLRTSAGVILVAATDRGICAVSLGDSARTLEAGLRAEYPGAAIEPADEQLRRWTAAVVAHLEGTGTTERLPLDVRGTAFQWQVWEALQRIPRGTTRTYGEIAHAIGRPTAARAVGRACGSNRVALVIPCHRAVRGDGEPGGYRWGAERKQDILERERREA
ncbi:MAG TPA: bifunctional DNA-binding transcriptional regulator/O6-methylguanine-DNA methyltransferase Ada [Gemmatimonadales bacterium]|nr:bifunctional DNA-binding transcriptional regulator/O6-methylguanine-DNA methyltransferase Ada [Gemmatimonadales bacterium]